MGSQPAPTRSPPGVTAVSTNHTRHLVSREGTTDPTENRVFPDPATGSHVPPSHGRDTADAEIDSLAGTGQNYMLLGSRRLSPAPSIEGSNGRVVGRVGGGGRRICVLGLRRRMEKS